LDQKIYWIEQFIRSRRQRQFKCSKHLKKKRFTVYRDLQSLFFTVVVPN
jgi:hypothetical protein